MYVYMYVCFKKYIHCLFDSINKFYRVRFNHALFNPGVVSLVF